MYTSKNFKSKKALKDAIARGEEITIYNPGTGNPPPRDGIACVEGPHFPEPHRWYGKVTTVAGFVTKVN